MKIAGWSMRSPSLTVRKYALCSQKGKLGIIQMIPEITTSLSPVTFRAPTDATALYRHRHLVTWQDQLFLVQRKFGSPSVFEVWEVDFETNQFNRLFNLDGFIIFICRRFSAAICSSLPQEKNHVYFTHNSTLYAFHIAISCLYPSQFGSSIRQVRRGQYST